MQASRPTARSTDSPSPTLPLLPPSRHPLIRFVGGWRGALLRTVALWLFVLVLYLPVITAKHVGEPWTGSALDASTILASIALAMPLYGLVRATEAMSGGRRTLLLAAGVVAAATVQTGFDVLFTSWVARNLTAAWADVPRTILSSYGSLLNYCCVYGVNLVLFHLAETQARERRQERRLAEARAAAQDSRVATLRFQINPHFLFNALNGISAMIVTRRNAEAEEMTDRLSAFLRASFAADPATTVPLRRELAVVADYLAVEAIRFGDRLATTIDATPEAEALPVPAFIVQPLVENAIKHGVSPSRVRVTLRVTARIEDGTLVLAVEDDGGAIADAVTAAGDGTGLRDVRRRLDAFYGRAATLNVQPGPLGFTATMRLPAG